MEDFVFLQTLMLVLYRGIRLALLCLRLATHHCRHDHRPAAAWPCGDTDFKCCRCSCHQLGGDTEYFTLSAK